MKGCWEKAALVEYQVADFDQRPKRHPRYAALVARHRMVLFALEQAGGHFPEGRLCCAARGAAEGKQPAARGTNGARARCEHDFPPLLR